MTKETYEQFKATLTSLGVKCYAQEINDGKGIIGLIVRVDQPMKFRVDYVEPEPKQEAKPEQQKRGRPPKK